MKARRLEEILFKGLMIISLGLVLTAFAGIIFVIVTKGASTLSLSMIIDTPKGGYYLGKEGGIANAIVGSLFLAFGASFLSVMISLPVAFAMQPDYTSHFAAYWSRLVL